MVKVSHAISRAAERLEESPESAEQLKRAKAVVEHYKTARIINGVDSGGRLRALQAECHVENWYDDELEVRLPEIAKMVAKLLGSFPT